ncbi:alpha/beta hydrolase [uncultured Bacteroides sp.]|uniref:alpha/beta hydrolase n=1 Tax=uncultured Bacteroides sp. TaxID=162156 RepID=UPI002639BC34|nr:alpha/beta hydrolase [uncultured Bacteroides sp.]
MKKGVKYGLMSGPLLVIIAIIIVASFYMLDYSLNPKSNNGKDIQGSYSYMRNEYPHICQWMDSLLDAGALKDTFIVNPEGVRLHAIYAAAPEPTAKTAVIVHGYTDNCIRMLMLGYLYHKNLKYNILLPDLQNHGLSEGKSIQMGWKDRKDVLTWMDVANDLFQKPFNIIDTIYTPDGRCNICRVKDNKSQMVVHGISMGAATTMMLSGEKSPYYVCCFVEDCGYTSVWDEFSHELKKQFNLPAFPLMYTTSGLCKVKYGWGFEEASSLKQVKKSRHPMLFIHGDADTYVPTWMVHTLYEAKPGHKELWIVPGTAHAMSYKEHPEEYTARVKSFVEKYVQ